MSTVKKSTKITALITVVMVTMLSLPLTALGVGQVKMDYDKCRYWSTQIKVAWKPYKTITGVQATKYWVKCGTQKKWTYGYGTTIAYFYNLKPNTSYGVGIIAYNGSKEIGKNAFIFLRTTK